MNEAKRYLGWLMPGFILVAAAAGMLWQASHQRAITNSPERLIRPSGLTYAIFRDLTTLNRLANYGRHNSIWNSYVLSRCHMSLYGEAPPTFQHFLPALAKTYPLPSFKRERSFFTATIGILDFIRWNDGTPLTAEDVAFTYNKLLEFGADKLGGLWPTFLQPEILAQVEAIDAYTVKFFLKKQPGLLAWEFGILGAPIIQKKFWEPIMSKALASSDPVTALFNYYTFNEPCVSAFNLVRWEPGRLVEEKAFYNWSWRGLRTTLFKAGGFRRELDTNQDGIKEVIFETDFGQPRGLRGDIALQWELGPFVDSLTFKIFPNQAAAMLALINGEVDYILSPTGLEPGVRKQLEERPGVKIVRNSGNNIFYLGFNLRREPFYVEAFRKAVAILIDKEFVAGQVLEGTVIPAYSIVPPASPWLNSDVPTPGKGLSRVERIQEAVKLLKSAGFAWEEEPVVDLVRGQLLQPGRSLHLPDGRLIATLELLHPGEEYDPKRAIFAMWIERWLNEVGIPVKAIATSFTTLGQQVFAEQNADMWISGWSFEGTYPIYLDELFHSSRSRPGNLNASGYSHPEYDQLLKEFRSARDLQKAREIAFQLQQLLAMSLPIIPLFNAPLFEAFDARVQFPFTEVFGGIQRVTGVPGATRVSKD